MLQVSSNSSSLNIFISYCHADRSKVDPFLERFNSLCKIAAGYDINLWMDNAILPGQYWRKEITDALTNADFGLLLVSPHFFASDFIRTDELPHFVSPCGQPLVSHKTAIPVLLRPIKLNLIDTRVLSGQQIFNLNGQSFYETKGAQRDHFVNELLSAMINVAETRRLN